MCVLSLDSKEEKGGSDQYKKLLDLGLVDKVAAKLDTIYGEGLVNVCDDVIIIMTHNYLF